MSHIDIMSVTILKFDVDATPPRGFLGTCMCVVIECPQKLSRLLCSVYACFIHTMVYWLTVFLALNVAFLAGTALWFRIDHARSASRFQNSSRQNHQLVTEIMWQFSLRSNLLLWGCVLSSYLIYIGELEALLLCFAGFSLINVVTDVLFPYSDAPLFATVKQGHRSAAIVIWSVMFVYYLMTARHAHEVM